MLSLFLNGRQEILSSSLGRERERRVPFPLSLPLIWLPFFAKGKGRGDEERLLQRRERGGGDFFVSSSSFLNSGNEPLPSIYAGGRNRRALTIFGRCEEDEKRRMLGRMLFFYLPSFFFSSRNDNRTLSRADDDERRRFRPFVRAL